jgi:hypothetical protein
MEASDISPTNFEVRPVESIPTETSARYQPVNPKQIPFSTHRCYAPIKKEVIQDGIKFKVEALPSGKMHYRSKANNQLYSLTEKNWLKVWKIIQEENK